MDQTDLLRLVVVALDGVRASYAITGSQASIHYGEQRFTNDIDVVADLTIPQLGAFLDHFPIAEDFYVSEAAARVAIRTGGQFNIIHSTSGQKIDVIIPASPFDRDALTRARTVTAVPGLSARLMAPEDLILKKLEFYREGGSEKHLRDIAGMLDVSWERIDVARIEYLVNEIGLRPEWQLVFDKWKTS